MFFKPKTITRGGLDALAAEVAKSKTMRIITGEEMRGYVGSSGCQEFPFSYSAFEWRRDHCEWGWNGGYVRMESGTIVWKDSLISSGSYSGSGSGSYSGSGSSSGSSTPPPLSTLLWSQCTCSNFWKNSGGNFRCRLSCGCKCGLWSF